MKPELAIGVSRGLAAEFLLSGLPGAETGFDVVELGEESGLDSVRSGAVDMALVPTLSVVIDPDEVEVVPAVALSSWRYPFAQLFLNGGLDTTRETVLYDIGNQVEADLARIILKEHYGIEATFRIGATDSDTSGESRLRVGNSVPLEPFDGLRLDLGQEWFELASYPMVWSVFVMRRGSVTASVVQGLREIVERTEVLRPQWADSSDGSASIRQFFLDDVRVRFDDLAVASITQLMDYAFFYNLIDEVRDFPIASIEIDEADSGPAPKL